MAYVITEPCVGVKDKSCVDVCPVDCIYGADSNWLQLYIHPTECIDCAACVSACPVSAIYHESDVPDNQQSFIRRARVRFGLDTPTPLTDALVSAPERTEAASTSELVRNDGRSETLERDRAELVHARERLMASVRAFEAVLEAGAEAPIQRFLEQHPELLMTSTESTILEPKFRLADEFECDFVGLGRCTSWRMAIRPVFIEIERANGKLFTKKGDPSSFLVHAIRQVQDWKAWNDQNRDFVAARLDKLVEKSARQGQRINFLEMSAAGFLGTHFRADYLVIAGRHRDLSVSDVIRLAQMNEDLSGVSIVTWDKLIDNLAWNHGYWWDGSSLRMRNVL